MIPQHTRRHNIFWTFCSAVVTLWLRMKSRTVRESMVVDQVLPDRDGVAPTRHRVGDDLAARLAGAALAARLGGGR